MGREVEADRGLRSRARYGGREGNLPDTLNLRRACACSDAVRFAAQPSSTYGSVDDLVQRGTSGGARITAAFIDDIGDAVEGRTTKAGIRKALARVARDFDYDGFAEAVERELMTGQMLGSLDSQFEIAHDTKLEVEAFSAQRLAAGDEEDDTEEEPPKVDPRFTAHPYADAIADFESREVVAPNVFKSMTAAARRKSFTVSGATSGEMLQTAKDELARVIKEGSDLREFRRFVTERLEGAGWTPANPSHVETIFRTNVQSAYSAGRWKQMTQPDVAELRPFIQILTPNDGPPRQRPNHQAAHGLIFRLDDPAFPESLTPWDFNCRCRYRSMSARQVGDATITPGSWLRDNELPAPGFSGGGRL